MVGGLCGACSGWSAVCRYQSEVHAVVTVVSGQSAARAGQLAIPKCPLAAAQLAVKDKGMGLQSGKGARGTMS